MKQFILIIFYMLVIYFSNAQSWNITGNSGTNPPTNFLGTTDDKALVLKTNNTERVRILSGGNFGIGFTNPLQKLDVNGNINMGTGFGLYIQNQRILKIDSTAQNTFLGNKTGFSITTGHANTATGYSALCAATTGAYNTANGIFSLAVNSSGNYNSAYGAYSLNSNTTGANNTATGRAALYRNSSGYYNTAVGDEALYENGTGYANTAVGINSLGANTTGHDNTAMGRNALFNNISGYSNVAMGSGALFISTTNNNLVAIGDSALYSNTAGTFNTAIGSKTLYSNSSGVYNAATGYNALYSNNRGQHNTASGAFALYSNVDGFANTAVGSMALYYNTGYDNTATGESSLFSNTTGHNNVADGENASYYNENGNFNVAVGQTALFANISGSSNTAIGAYAMDNNQSGGYSTAIGYNALNATKTAYYNTAVGYNAGAYYDNGFNNVFLGAETNVNTDGLYNVVAVGHSTLCTASSQARIGNSFTTSIGGYVGWSNISDGRVKKNIKQNVPGLAFINKLQPVTYNLNLDAADKIIQAPVLKDKDGKQVQPSPQDIDARKAKEQIVYTGFIAQDVEKAAKSLHYDFSGVDAAKNDKDLYGLRYAEFVVPLVKAVQELSKMNDDKDAKINDLQNQINELKAIALSHNVSQSSANGGLLTISSASLQQNIPNPFSNITTINYTLPQQFSSARIIITNKNGNALKQINLSDKCRGSVTVDAATLSSGAYQYSLIIDGRMVDSKQMMLTR